MKKTTSTASSTQRHQHTSQETRRPVVTQLRANVINSAEPIEPDIDLNELRAAVEELPELNATKVVALHRCIVNGDYKIDAERLADKLLELESFLDSE